MWDSHSHYAPLEDMPRLSPQRSLNAMKFATSLFPSFVRHLLPRAWRTNPAARLRRGSQGSVRLCFGLAAVGVLCAWPVLSAEEAASSSSVTPRFFEQQIRPVLTKYCLGCHSTEKQKGDLDLERFQSLAEVLRHPKVWQGVAEQLALGEMPPKEKPQPAPRVGFHRYWKRRRKRGPAIQGRWFCGG
jgi:hypothetical protein